mmetsp:Transcript_63487/g.146077  ORF Transcript_63487/g.146077 Transcript_63487/m.146077 type:complete len:206 (-) Transcript_63487:172-789(-)
MLLVLRRSMLDRWLSVRFMGVLPESSNSATGSSLPVSLIDITRDFRLVFLLTRLSSGSATVCVQTSFRLPRRTGGSGWSGAGGGEPLGDPASTGIDEDEPAGGVGSALASFLFADCATLLEVLPYNSSIFCPAFLTALSTIKLSSSCNATLTRLFSSVTSVSGMSSLVRSSAFTSGTAASSSICSSNCSWRLARANSATFWETFW